jgi:hypothetical protein
MTPFQEFRLWARRAPAGERAFAGFAAVLALALLAWLLVPSGGDDETELTAFDGGSGSEVAGDSTGGDGTGADAGGGTTPGAEAGVVDDPAAGGSTPGAGAGGGDPGAGGGGGPEGGTDAGGGGGGAGPAAQGDRCPPVQGEVRGVSDGEIKIAGILTNIVGPAANNLFGIPSVEEQEQLFAATLKSINDEGGLGCRKVSLKLYRGNPTDQNGLQQLCLQIVQDGAFAVVDTGAYAAYPQKQCFAQNGVPYFGGYFLNREEQAKFFPFLFALQQFEILHRNTALGLRDLGFFGQGFQKLGLLHQSCNPSMVRNMKSSLAEAGISGGKLVAYDLGCPAVFSSPADLSQAVLTFQRAGVTHVTMMEAVGDFANFTRIAQQQGFKPRYGIPDEALISISYGNQPPDPNQLDNALAITSARNGEERTPGVKPTEGTQRCNAIYAAAGKPTVYEMPSLAGNLCNQWWMLRAAVNSAPALQANALAAGLQRAGSVEFSFPTGPNDFRKEGSTTAGQFWRPAKFELGCRCWKLAAPDFRPSF